jgi:exosortase
MNVIAAVPIALLLLVYGATLKGLTLEWASSPDASYGAILAAVALAIAWRRRDAVRLAMQTPSHHAGGLALLVSGLLLYMIGQLGADVFATRVSLVVVVAGATWYLAGGRAARVLAPPLFFLLLAVPLPALIVNAITLPMQLVASRLAEGLLSMAGVPVFRDGNILELQTTSLQVAEACSGLRSLISLTAIACLIAWATERSVARRAVVVAAAIPIAIALNGVRIAATGIAVETWGRHMARGGWHEFSGWVTFVVAVLVLMQFQRVLPHVRWRRRTVAPEMASI